MREKILLIKKYNDKDNTECEEKVAEGYVVNNVFITGTEECNSACHVNRTIFSVHKGFLFGNTVAYGNLETIITETEIDNHYNYENIYNLSIYDAKIHNTDLSNNIIGEYTLSNTSCIEEYKLTAVTDIDDFSII
ncbi:hypothetical protein CAXC1_80009 [Candidatus Xenohaliotis californiensis]|uniref:Right handed beta helix domain-containing protein n=1 Tax=Candidatus Xenohaliotis californiensis TaxID=84677 RepID=A0ABM9N9B9_9RICK|nr:hypothetical protein CAXC1_80009 [Candidatus Xenohaliotis californiensis]